MGSSLGFPASLFGNMPWARDTADFGPTSQYRLPPNTAFRLYESVGIGAINDFGADPHGLLPCCVRFAPTSRPVNGNTRY
jgi:hypothetical protein